MAYEVTYTHDTEQPIRVMFPEYAAPFIPQSSYTYGGRARIEMCSDINHVVYEAYCTLASAPPSTYPGAASLARDFAIDIMDKLMACVGYKRGAEERM